MRNAITGKDLILYILQNDLLEVSVFNDGHFLNCLTIPEAAVHYQVGEATIRTWIELGLIQYIQLGNEVYLPRNYSHPAITNNERMNK